MGMRVRPDPALSSIRRLSFRQYGLRHVSWVLLCGFGRFFRLITGVHRAGRGLSGDFCWARATRCTGVKRRSSSFNTERIDHLYRIRTRPTAVHPALRRHDGCDQPDPARAGGAARRDLQPRRAVPCPGQLRDPGIHRQRRRARHAAPARGDPHPRAGEDRRASTRPRPPSSTAWCRRRRSARRRRSIRARPTPWPSSTPTGSR
jgi:hypothetical protein